MKSVYVYDAIRTPRGKASADGGLHDLKPQALLHVLYSALENRTGLDPIQVGEIILGCVTQSGDQAANIAKTSALFAGWPDSVGGVTVNRFCSSSIDAITLAMLKIGAGMEQAMIAGGVEMMSRVPMLSDGASVFTDPEMAARCRVLLMGSGADLIASLQQVSRAQADAVALLSQKRASQARENGYYRSIVPVRNPVKGLDVTADECIRPQTSTESLAALAPAFAGLGAAGADAMQLDAYPQLNRIHHIHTAGNSPAMADGAALTLLGDETLATALGRQPRARLVAAASANDDPLQVLGGCVKASQRLLTDTGLSSADIDLFELHEAFAATVVRAQHELDINEDKLNVNGGVIALGHPMGATGAIMLGTLLDELERRDLQRGLVAASGAAGAGSALLLERM